MKKLFILLLVLSLFFPIINADVISLNSGGSDNVVITGKYIEGFFSGTPSVGPICGNGVIETGETCDDGNTVSGDGCSSTCQTETSGEEPPSGGGGGVEPPISVTPTEFNINLAINTNVEKIIIVTNTGSSTATVNVLQQNLENHVLFNTTSFQLAPGQSKELKVVFVATSETGIFTGRLIVGGKIVSVSLNVKTKLLLFDSNIIVLNEDYKVPQGDKLRTEVALIPMGDKERMDVSLYYVIKDYQGNTYLTKSETLLIEKQMDFKRNFGTGSLPIGKYIVGLELVYPSGVAPSSAHFEVTEKKPMDFFSKIIFFLIIFILLILILLIIFLIRRERDKKKQESGEV